MVESYYPLSHFPADYFPSWLFPVRSDIEPTPEFPLIADHPGFLADNIGMPYPFQAPLSGEAPRVLQLCLVDAVVLVPNAGTNVASVEITDLDMTDGGSLPTLTIVSGGLAYSFTDDEAASGVRGQYTIVEWTSDTTDAVAKLTFFTPAMALVAWPVTSLTGAVLDPSCVITQPPLLTELDVVTIGESDETITTPLTGIPILAEGYNCRMTLQIESADGEEDNQNISCAFQPTAGLGQEACVSTSPLVTTINGIAAQPNGNFILQADDSWLPTDQAGGMKLDNYTGPCCKCDDYVNSYEAARRLYNLSQNLKADLLGVNSYLKAAIDGLTNLVTLIDSTSLLLVRIWSQGDWSGTVYVQVSNPYADPIPATTLTITVSVTGLAGVPATLIPGSGHFTEAVDFDSAPVDPTLIDPADISSGVTILMNRAVPAHSDWGYEFQFVAGDGRKVGNELAVTVDSSLGEASDGPEYLKGFMQDGVI
jgi:hypothetical protein